MARVFRRRIAYYLYTTGVAPPYRKELIQFVTDIEMLPDLLPLVQSRLEAITITAPAQSDIGAELGIAVLNNYHYMPVVPFGGRLIRGTKVPIWPDARRGELWQTTAAPDVEETSGPRQQQRQKQVSKVAARSRAHSWPRDHCSTRAKDYLVKDAHGRLHVTIPPFVLSTLSLRSVKYNSVSISTHSADFELAVSAQLKSTPQIVAINHTGDGNGTRTVNILSWWHSVRKLTKLNPTLGIWAFGQYWADDSPSNRIEHLWMTSPSCSPLSRSLRFLLDTKKWHI